MPSIPAESHISKTLEKLSDVHAKYYTDMGYGMPVKLDGQIVALGKYLYTTAIVVGMDDHGYLCRYCYETEDQAMIALLKWIGDEEDEPIGYITKK